MLGCRSTVLLQEAESQVALPTLKAWSERLQQLPATDLESSNENIICSDRYGNKPQQRTQNKFTFDTERPTKI